MATSNVQSAEKESDSLLAQQRLTQYVKYLSSDDLEGRGPGTDGINKAAEYIATQLKMFKSEQRNNDLNGVMRTVAGYMSEAQINAVSEYIQGVRRN